MQFGTFHIFNRREDQTSKQVYHEQLEQIDWAEQLGYDSVWLTEHHFTEYGIMPDPLVLAANIAQRTKRVKIGMAVSVLPFHNPVRLAEQAAMIDLLSDGRLILGIGRGYQPIEFRAFGLAMEEARDRFDESLELMQRLWTETNVTFKGKYYQVNNVTLEPRPERPIPIQVATSGTPATLDDIAHRRLLMLQGFAAAEGIAKYVERHKYYAEVRRRQGDSEAEIEKAIQGTGVLRRVYVADDMEKAWEDPKEAILWFYSLLDHLNLPKDLESQIPEEYLYQKGLAQERAKQGYPDFWNHGIFGDVDTCVQKVLEARAASVNNLLCWTSLGGLAQDKVLHSMELFAKQVMPKVEAATAAPVG